MKFKIFVATAVCSIWSSSLCAGNVTIVQQFTGMEDTMPVSEASNENNCWPVNPSAFLPYVDIGQITVSQSGQYRVADFWLWTDAPTPVKGSANTVLFIYEGSFDERRPERNRIAIFDYGEWNQVNGEDWVQLESTNNYRIVLQKTCDAEPGIGGFVMRGPGNITGVGQPTSAHNYGDFSAISNDNFADFGDEWGFHKFAEPYMFQAPRSGYYRFFDLSPGLGGGGTGVRIYSAPFDQENPSANLLAASEYYWPWATAVYLKAGQVAYVVRVDIYDSEGYFQTIMHLPGELTGITSDFVGTYFDQSKKGQGFLVDMDDDFEFLFTALFTYTNAPIAALESVYGSRKESVGSPDQRWLTAYGPFSENSKEVDLTFELTSGGRFNAMEPPSERQDVGTGKLVAHDCETIDIQYSLPDGDGVFNLSRLLPGFIQDCAASVPVGEPVP